MKRLSVFIVALLVLLNCSEKVNHVENTKDINSFQYAPTEVTQEGLDVKSFSTHWKKFLIFNNNNIAREQEAFLTQVGGCVQIDLPDFKIVTGLYEALDGSRGGYIAKIRKEHNVVEQIKEVYRDQNRLIILRQNPTNFYICNRFETEFDSQATYENIEKLNGIPE